MRPSRRTAVIAIVVLVIAVAAVATWWLLSRDDDPSASEPSPSPTVSTSPTAAARPTTTPEPTSVPTEPNEPAQPSVAPTAPVDPAAPVPTAVDVVTSYAFWNEATSALEAAGYANTVESAGVCTITATQGGTTASTSVAASQDASTMACGGLALGRDQVGSGTWQIVTSYASSAFAGTAAPVTVEIP